MPTSPTRRSSLTREYARRAAFIGLIAWTSLCLLTVGIVPYLRDQLSVLWILSGLLGLASAVGLIEVVKAEQKNHDLRARAMKRSKRDELTGLPNRWEFDRLINIMIGDARMHDLKLCLLLIDIDSLQSVNRHAGYAVGDEVLTDVARCVLTSTRGADLVSRYDEDGFAVVMADVNSDKCVEVMERLRGHVRDVVSANKIPVTVSVGAAEIIGDEDVSDLQHRAELALFNSKSEGGNVTSFHDGEQVTNVRESPALRIG